MNLSELISCDRCLGPVDGGIGTMHGLLCPSCEKVMSACVCAYDHEGNRIASAMCTVAMHVEKHYPLPPRFANRWINL